MILSILGKKWKVLFKKAVYDQGRLLGGTTDDITKKIEVNTTTAFTDKEQQIEEVSRIFYHEFAHAVFTESDIRDQSWWNEDVEHLIIAPLARALAHNLPLRDKTK